MKKVLMYKSYYGWEKVVKGELLAWVESEYPGQSMNGVRFCVRILQSLGPTKGTQVKFGPISDLFIYQQKCEEVA